MKNNIEKLINEKIESLIHIICEKYPRVKRDQLYLKVKQLHLYTPCGETSGRKSSLPQKKRFSILESIEEARSIITNDSGTHFDPDIVQTFVDNFERFKAIADAYGE